MEKKEDEKPRRVICPVCHGMSVKELPNGNTTDCTNRKCDNGFIENK